MDKKNYNVNPNRENFKLDSYELFAVEDNNNVRFFVKFRDSLNNDQIIEIEKELYEQFKKFKQEEKSQKNKDDRYIIKSNDLQDGDVLNLLSTKISAEDECTNNTLRTHLLSIISKLTNVQSKYIYLHYFSGMSCKQIAEMDRCSVQNVYHILKTAKRNLKNLLENSSKL